MSDDKKPFWVVLLIVFFFLSAAVVSFYMVRAMLLVDDNDASSFMNKISPSSWLSSSGIAILQVKALKLYPEGILAEMQDTSWVFLSMQSSIFDVGDVLKVSGKKQDETWTCKFNEVYNSKIPIYDVWQAGLQKAEEER